jgi:HlyD family secretion protein
MTATLQFQTGATNDALIVPNSALRFKPTADVLTAAGITTGARPAGASTGAARGSTTGAGASTGAQPGATHAHTGGNHGVVWVLNNGKLTPVRVTTGLTDGQQTAVTGTGLAAGDQVITGTSTGTTAAAAASASKSPLQPQGGARRPGGF